MTSDIFEGQIVKTKRTIIVDLDGTLCNDGHRKSLLDGNDWDGYHSQCFNDEVFEDVLMLIRAFSYDGYTILIMTGRNERWRKMTENWLFVKSISQFIDRIYMRPDEDYTPAPELKLKMITSPEFAGLSIEEIALAVEDTEKVIVAFRNAGIVTYQVRG